MAAKKAPAKSLSGVGNKALHQYIISDLIFGVRKQLAKIKKASAYSALSEISISEIGYKIGDTNYNIDFVVIDESSKDILFMAEIEREGDVDPDTIVKITNCLKKIATIKEAFIITFDEAGNTKIELCSIEGNRLKRTIPESSKSNFLGIALKLCFTSTKRAAKEKQTD